MEEGNNGNKVDMNTSLIRDCSKVYLQGSCVVCNTPVVFGRMQWGWSQPGQAPGTAGGRHPQTACLARPGLEQGPPMGPG